MGDDPKKPAYDARQEYVKLLVKWLELSGECADDEDLYRMYRHLQLVFQLVRGWISSHDAARIQRRLANVERTITATAHRHGGYLWAASARRRRRQRAEYQLMGIMGEITTAAKHMMLPTGADETYGTIDFSTVEEFN